MDIAELQPIGIAFQKPSQMVGIKGVQVAVVAKLRLAEKNGLPSPALESFPEVIEKRRLASDDLRLICGGERELPEVFLRTVMLIVVYELRLLAEYPLPVVATEPFPSAMRPIRTVPSTANRTGTT